MSKIVIDHVNLIAFSHITEFLDIETIVRITLDVDEAVKAFGDKIALHGRLFDLTGAKVAPPKAIDALGATTDDPARAEMRANRVAYFGASPLAQMQVKRLCELRPSHALFNDRSAAFAWAVGGRPEAFSAATQTHVRG